MTKELSCKDVTHLVKSDYHEFAVKSHIEINEQQYDEHIADLRCIENELDYTIAMNELSKHPKKYRNFKYTKRGKKMVETKLERKLFLKSLLDYELKK